MTQVATTTDYEVIDSSHIQLIHKAEVDIQISTAKAFPRSMDLFMKDAMSMVSISPDVAEQMTYRLPRGGKAIEGPSVRLSEIVLVCYGNISAGARIVSNDGKKITAEGVCIDAQRNVRIVKEVQVRITDKNGVTYNDDMQIVTGNAACSKAMRNAIFAVVPKALVNPIQEHAKKVARGDEKTLPQRRDAAIQWYKSNGATDALVCAALGIRNLKDITLDHLENLSGWKVAATEGDGGSLKDRLIQILKEAAGGEESTDWAGIADRLEAIATKIKPTDYQNGLAIIADKDEAAVPVLLKTIEAAEKA